MERVPSPTAEEEDMLDLARSLAPTSRLGCQIRLSDEPGRPVRPGAAHPTAGLTCGSSSPCRGASTLGRRRRCCTRPGHEVGRRHAAALRPWRRDRAQGRLLRRAGHPRRPRVADRLGIPHYVLDCESALPRGGDRRFRRQLRRGAKRRFPACAATRRVKFSDLLALARDLGAEALATGHYARRVEGRDGPELHRAADAARDQSYFLFATTPAQLDLPAFRWASCRQGGSARHAARLGLRGGRQARQPGHLLRADRPLLGRGRPAAPRGRSSRATSSTATGAVLGRHAGHCALTVGQRPRPGRSPAGERASRGRHRRATPPGDGGPAPGRRCSEVALGEVNWLVAARRRRACGHGQAPRPRGAASRRGDRDRRQACRPGAAGEPQVGRARPGLCVYDGTGCWAAAIRAPRCGALLDRRRRRHLIARLPDGGVAQR